MSDLCEGFLLEEVAVVFHVISELREAFRSDEGFFLNLCVWVNVVLACDFWGYLDHGLIEHDGDRVEVVSVGGESETLCFEGDRASSCEGVEEFGEGLREFCEFSFCGFEGVGVDDVVLVPLNEFCEDGVEALAVGVVAGVVDEGGPEYCAGCGDGFS